MRMWVINNNQSSKIKFNWIFRSQTGHQAVKIHIIPNISRSKGNQAVKLGQLVEYNMRNIFLEKSFTKCGGEASPRPLYKKLKLCISLNQQSGIL